MKTLINKEESRIEGVIFSGMKLNFWVMKWVKWLKNKGFDDMGYDKGLGE